jgi:hypothetical protein
LNNRVRSFLVIAGVGYLIVVSVLVLGLAAARQSALEHFGTAGAQQAWDEWRQSTSSAGSDGVDPPVRRSVPRSAEPPTLVLLRDHFVGCLAAGIGITSALYWSLALLIRGVVAGPSFPLGTENEATHLGRSHTAD